MSNHCYIIAEAGVNHNGSVEIAKKLIEKAAEARVDAIKFQTFIPEMIVSQFAEKAEYQKETTDASESQLEMLRKLQLSFEDHIVLKDYAEKKEITFISTPFDIPSIDFLNKLDIPFFKIPSGEITNYPYLVKVGRLQKRVVMSTGMSTIDEIRQAYDLLTENGCPEIALLHCNTQYPTPYEDVNLAAMQTLRNEFGCSVGYSDHTKGIEVPVAAVALGAEIIEKHFTLDRNMEGPDHRASLEPDELKQMVIEIRNIEKARGSEKKKVTGSELGNRSIARKSIVAMCDIKKGDTFSEKNLTVKRPGTGISPMRWPEVIGKIAIRDFCQDELIEI